MRCILPITLMMAATIGFALPAAADPNDMLQQQQQLLLQQLQQQAQQQAEQQAEQQDQQQQTLQFQMQQQLQQQQLTNQGLGVAGVQPYCSSYGTCPDPFPSRSYGGPNLGTLLLGSLFDQGEQAAPAGYPSASDPATPYPGRRHRHHRRYHASR